MPQLTNSPPQGGIQGDLALIQFRTLGLDGHASVGLETYAFTRHALLATIRLASELLEALEQAEGASVEDMRRKHG